MDITAINESIDVIFLFQNRFMISYAECAVLILEYFDNAGIISRIRRFIVHNILFGFIL